MQNQDYKPLAGEQELLHAALVPLQTLLMLVESEMASIKGNPEHEADYQRLYLDKHDWEVSVKRVRRRLEAIQPPAAV